MSNINRYQKGAVSGWMVAAICLIVVVLGLGSLSIWALLNYQEAKTNIDGKIEVAQAEAKREQAEEDEAKFAEREKEPRREFASPDDYGRLAFTYPKTWSVYVDEDPTAGSSRNDFKAYLHPITVPSIKVRDQQFALRVSVLNQNYDEYLDSFSRQIEDGDLRSSTVSINGENGVRLDGNFNDNIRGSAVIFKIRDKTAVVQTDADTFKHDFDTLIKTISYIR